MFIDIVGYSKGLINEQSELLQKLKPIVRHSEQVQLAEAQGKLLRLPTGDGGALVFRTSPEAPALCAMEIAQALKSHPELRVRMGIHSGPVNAITDLNEQVNIAGAGINMAQRVMDCGDAGHILLSKHVAEDLEHYRQWQPCLHDLGKCEVKHGLRVHLFNLYTDEIGNSAVPQKLKFQPAATIPPPRKNRRNVLLVTATALVVAGLVGVWFMRKHARPAATSAPEKSIAVLPFENLSSDKENAYFAEGIQDEILTRLSKIAELKVISRTSTQHYKSAPENLPGIARQLGVAQMLEGSVQKSADAVRVNVQLIKAANDSHLWAETFDRKLTARPTENAEAYDAYLRGLAFTLKTATTPANLLNAQKYLKEAVRLDPKFALGWALLASVNARRYITQTLQPTAALREETCQAAETALALQPKLGEALLAAGSYLLCVPEGL